MYWIFILGVQNLDLIIPKNIMKFFFTSKFSYVDACVCCALSAQSSGL
jgi:hypothetical protein